MINYRAILIIILLFLALGISSNAQDDIIKAFEDSYIFEKIKDYKGAVQKLRNAYRTDSYEVNLRLGWLTYQSGQLDESVGYYNRAISLKPYALEPKFGLALPLSAQGKWDDIIELYNKILETDPQNTIANYRMGLIYYNRGEYERAHPYIEKVVNLYPFDYDSLLLFGWNNLKLQKIREAKILFQKVLMYNPGDASALEGLSFIP
jgi:tetratricopeptide (TPR) repeat protein